LSASRSSSASSEPFSGLSSCAPPRGFSSGFGAAALPRKDRAATTRSDDVDDAFSAVRVSSASASVAAFFRDARNLPMALRCALPPGDASAFFSWEMALPMRNGKEQRARASAREDEGQLCAAPAGPAARKRALGQLDAARWPRTVSHHHGLPKRPSSC